MNSMKVLALIPARGGSKGLPRKNLLKVAGRPLIAWTIDAALKSSVIDQLILSSDDAEIMEVAKAFGCAVPFKRPSNLASDTASSMDVVLHAINELPSFEYIILLQPTSPMRTATDIDAAFKLLIATSAPSCVSVTEVEQSPYWMYQLTDGFNLRKLMPEHKHITRRQDLPAAYMLNGALYIAKVDWLLQTKDFTSEGCIAYEMKKENSIDIDSVEDLELFRSRVEMGKY